MPAGRRGGAPRRREPVFLVLVMGHFLPTSSGSVFMPSPTPVPGASEAASHVVDVLVVGGVERFEASDRRAVVGVLEDALTSS